MKRALFGFLWFLALYLGCSFAIALYVMATVGATDAAVVTAESAALGARFGPLMFFGSLLIAILGTWKGWLPGTTKKPASPPAA